MFAAFFIDVMWHTTVVVWIVAPQILANANQTFWRNVLPPCSVTTQKRATGIFNASGTSYHKLHQYSVLPQSTQLTYTTFVRVRWVTWSNSSSSCTLVCIIFCSLTASCTQHNYQLMEVSPICNTTHCT